MIKIQINKVLETCIVVDSAIYKPVYSCEATDFYEIPCKLNEKINMQIIHYSRSYNAGIYSVINNKRNNKLHSLIGEMKSLDIDLYYCRLNAIVVSKKSNSNIIINVEKICCKNIIGNSSYCDLKIIQNKNAQIDALNIQHFPSKKVKLCTFFVELLFSLCGFVLCIVGVIIAGKYTVEHWYNAESGSSPFIYFLEIVPLCLFFLIMLVIEIKRVVKCTLKLN